MPSKEQNRTTLTKSDKMGNSRSVDNAIRKPLNVKRPAEGWPGDKKRSAKATPKN
jgi:hypothetical protein